MKPPDLVNSEETKVRTRPVKSRTPLPEPVLGGSVIGGSVLNDVRAQFDKALSKMHQLNQQSSLMLAKEEKPDEPMRMDELATSFGRARSFRSNPNRTFEETEHSLRSSGFEPLQSVPIEKPAVVEAEVNVLTASTAPAPAPRVRKMSPQTNRKNKPPKRPPSPKPVVKPKRDTLNHLDNARRKLNMIPG